MGIGFHINSSLKLCLEVRNLLKKILCILTEPYPVLRVVKVCSVELKSRSSRSFRKEWMGYPKTVLAQRSKT